MSFTTPITSRMAGHVLPMPISETLCSRNITPSVTSRAGPNNLRVRQCSHTHAGWYAASSPHCFANRHTPRAIRISGPVAVESDIESGIDEKQYSQSDQDCGSDGELRGFASGATPPAVEVPGAPVLPPNIATKPSGSGAGSPN